MIFEWGVGSAKYAEYGGLTDEDDRKIWWSDSTIGDLLPPLTQWLPPRLTQYLGSNGKGKPRRIGDAPGCPPNHLISERAADALSDIWERHALLYPVKLEDAPEDPYFMVVGKTVIDCIDRDKSVGRKQQYSDTPHLFATIQQWVFDEACVGDNDLFCLPDSNETLWVSERFKDRVVAAKLKGFEFRTEFYDPKPFVS